MGPADELSIVIVGSVDSSNNSCNVNMEQFRSRRFISWGVSSFIMFLTGEKVRRGGGCSNQYYLFSIPFQNFFKGI